MSAAPSSENVLLPNQFYLKWNNHTNSMFQVFMEQLTTENLVDVTISCEGKFIKAHKMVLSASSPYFQEMFRIHDVSHPVVIMNGIKFTDIKQIIDFMYCGEIKVLETDLDDLLAVAENLQVKGLSNVRNKYEKGDIQYASKSVATNSKGPELKKRKIDSTTTLTSTPTSVTTETSNQKQNSTESDHFTSLICTENTQNIEKLASDIKVEPPDIDDSPEPTLDDVNQMVNESDPLADNPKTNPLVNNSKPKPITDNPKLSPATSNAILKKAAMIIKRYPVILPSTTTSTAILDVQTSNTLTTVPAVKSVNTSNMKPVVKIPRPPNAFMIFANQWRKTLASIHKTESNIEISCRLGNMWKKLGREAKEAYYRAARQADMEHKEKYPGYYYSPQEARQRKYSQLVKAAEANKTDTGQPQASPLQFVQVYMARKSDPATPVMIALEKPEVSVQIDQTYSMSNKEWDEQQKKLDLKEEIIDSSDFTPKELNMEFILGDNKKE